MQADESVKWATLRASVSRASATPPRASQFRQFAEVTSTDAAVADSGAISEAKVET
jgi:hypothetical protein